jgi:hypothetical protein
MDNANYNSTIRDKAPDRGSSKKDIQEWLQNHCTQYDPPETTPKLLLYTAPSRSQEKAHELYQTANENESPCNQITSFPLPV